MASIVEKNRGVISVSCPISALRLTAAERISGLCDGCEILLYTDGLPIFLLYSSEHHMSKSISLVIVRYTVEMHDFSFSLSTDG